MIQCIVSSRHYSINREIIWIKPISFKLGSKISSIILKPVTIKHFHQQMINLKGKQPRGW
jgi:hypothetical protein